MKDFQIGSGLTCNLDRLVDTRLLVQANSGGGKSWLLRRILEQTHGHVQHLIIDPEGEFASLRERFDYVLAARGGGDTAADPRSAALLAERLLELKVSAILDIYELKPHERVRFVRLFLEALVNAPKALWHPALVIVDEAHVYCPESGSAESADAVKDLATRGRKRGFCAVLATQRLSKLHKDAAAECNNKLIGRTTLDVDVKRAAHELGVTDREALLILRSLDPGEFFAYGPALHGQATEHGVVKTRTGAIETTHPKPGARLAFTPPPPTSKITALLPKLSDLPKEATERQRSLDDLQQELSNARREITRLSKAAPVAAAPVEPKTVEKFVLTDADRARLDKLGEAIEASASLMHSDLELASMRFRSALDRASDEYLGRVLDVTATAEQALRVELEKASVSKVLGKLAAIQMPNIDGSNNPHRNTQAAMTQRVDRQAPVSSPGREAVPAATARRLAPRVSIASSNGDSDVSPARQKVLNALAFLHGIGIRSADKTQLALLTGVSPTSGGYFNNLGALRSSGFIDYPSGGTVALTDAGARIASTAGIPETTAELHDAIQAKLPPAKWRILAALIRAYPHAIAKDALAELIDVSPTSGGYFNNLGSLRSLGLITYPQPGTAAAQRVLFLEER